MYVLDTNIVSEITKPMAIANPNAIDWLQDHNQDLYLTSVTIMELYYGIMRLPDGKRKRSLREHIDIIVQECSDKILPFDSFSGYLCGEMRCKAQSVGRVPAIADCMIAAICQRHGATLVTHNVKDFDYLDLKIVDPFEYESDTLKRLKAEEAKRAIE